MYWRLGFPRTSGENFFRISREELAGMIRSNEEGRPYRILERMYKFLIMFSVLKSKLNSSNFRSRTSPFLVSSSSLSTCVPYFGSSSIWTPKYLTLSTIGMSTAVSNFTQVGSGPTGISSRSSLAFVTSVSPSLRIIAPFPSNGLGLRAMDLS